MNRIKDTGRFEAFKCNWKDTMTNKPHIFWDSDIAKWIEAVAYILEKNKEEKIEALVYEIVVLIEKNRDESGYYKAISLQLSQITA